MSRPNPNVSGERVRSSEFTWSSLTLSFVAEVSSLDAAKLFRRIFADAADLGFVLVSETTGNEALFTLDESATEKRGGETVAWVFRPTEDSLRRTPSLRGVRVVCLNT